MVGLAPKMILHFLEAIVMLELSEFEVMKRLGVKLSEVWTREYLLQFSNDQLCQLCKMLSQLGQLDANSTSLILNQLVDDNCYKGAMLTITNVKFSCFRVE